MFCQTEYNGAPSTFDALPDLGQMAPAPWIPAFLAMWPWTSALIASDSPRGEKRRTGDVITSTGSSACAHAKREH